MKFLPKRSSVFASAFARHESRTLALNPAIPVFLGFAWALTAILTFYAGGFFATNRADATTLLGFLPWVMALIIPALTMHGWAEDWRRGTAERLLTLPITLRALVITRFAVSWALIGLFLLGTWPFLATLAWLGQPDWLPILTGYLGTWLLGGVMLAGSLLVAGLSRSYVTAFLSGFALNLALLVAGWGTLLAMLESFLPASFGPTLVTLQRVSLLEHLRLMLLGLVEARSLFTFAALITLFIGLHLASLTRRSQQGRGTGTAITVLSSAVLLMLAGHLLPLRWDATAEKRYTLSPATIQLVENLPAPLTLTLYESRTNPGVPYTSTLAAQHLKDVLSQLQAAAPSKIILRQVNPDTSMEAELKAVTEGIAPQPLPTKENFYLGLTAALGEAAGEGARTSVLPQVSAARIPYMEFDLASLITEAGRTHRKNLTVLSSANLNAPDMKPRFLEELQGLYNLTFLRPGEPAIPEETDALIVMPSPFLPEESLYAVDQFMAKGGRTLVLLDPAYRSGRDSSLRAADRNADGMGFDHPADLLRSWGVGYDWNVIVGDVTRASPISQEATLSMNEGDLNAGNTLGLGFSSYPMWLALDASSINSGLPFTAGLNRITLPEPGALYKRSLPQGLAYESVLQSSPNARSIRREDIDTFPAEVLTGRLSGTPAVRDLAALVTGNFASSFTDVPETVKNYYRDYAESPEAASWPTHTARTGKAGALMVVADADFPEDSFALGQQSPNPGNPNDAMRLVPINDNLVFLYNSIQYLLGDGELLGLRGKSTAPRTFTRVEAMLDDLSGRYVLTEQKIAAELFRVGNRLTELKQQQAEDASVANDPRREKEMQAWQSRDFALKKQLRQIRQSLRQDIQQLGHILALVNILAMPLILAAGVTLHRAKRRRRARL